MRRALLLVLLLATPSLASSTDICASRGTAVLVSTADHTLRLCVNGRSKLQFDVSLGARGTGKRQEGDGRTPLGTYPLGTPRPSNDGFGTFIPIGYPTAAQHRAGFTGGAVGIHGPPRGWTWLGPAFVALGDWTLGCVAVGSDAEIAQVAKFVRDNPSALVHIF